MCRCADDHDIVDVDRYSGAICFADIAPEEETGSCNRGLEIEVVNYQVKDFFIVLPIRLLDAVHSIIQLDEWSGAAIWIRPFAFREAHIESLMQRAAEEGTRDVEDSDSNNALGCMAEGKPNQCGINDWRGDVIVVARLMEIAAADKSNFPFVNCPISH